MNNVDPKASLALKIEKYFFKAARKISSLFFHSLGLRLPIYPYISGDSFRIIANHVYDEVSVFDPKNVQLGDTVFVGSTMMEKYFTTIHPSIKNKYILIEHNGDNMVDESIVKYIDEKIVRFYAQIVIAGHEKIVPIPIGIENKHHGNEIFNWLIPFAKSKNKKPRIFYHFSVQTNPPERIPALAYFKTHSVMDTISGFIPYYSYKKLLSSYYFTASPAGNTLGSCRTWEALYLGTIPIVKRTVDAEACVKLGVPLWIVDDWHELDNYTEEKLEKKYREMMARANFESIYMDYWVKRIEAEQGLLRQSQIK